MNKKQLWDLLADHADALNCIEGADGLDAASWLAGYAPIADRSSLLALLQLAQAVKRALVPVQPSVPFRSELGFRLTQAEVNLTGKWPFPGKIWRGAAVAGSVLSLIGLLVLILRRMRFASNRSRPVTTAV